MSQHKKSSIYTRTGDTGETSLFSGRRVPKNSPRLEACGALDVASSHIGLARSLLTGEATEERKQLDNDLTRIQHLLFNLGAMLACEDDHPPEDYPCVEQRDVDWMERRIDELDAGLPPLQQFILPGGSPAASALHVARAVIRRVERLIVGLIEREQSVSRTCLVFLNRLSDFLFILARHENQRKGCGDVSWDKDALDAKLID
ncbi:cob(I)yrinic acid a,c-diamide adenosyltransferase [Candidatus Sumerlaeota bacterium]|nr:cob(I)yrinic acid a,c-diamide adenosyltransferase [Candidatus Sumerlaeota bacterium]